MERTGNISLHAVHVKLLTWQMKDARILKNGAWVAASISGAHCPASIAKFAPFMFHIDAYIWLKKMVTIAWGEREKIRDPFNRPRLMQIYLLTVRISYTQKKKNNKSHTENVSRSHKAWHIYSKSCSETFYMASSIPCFSLMRSWTAICGLAHTWKVSG